MSAMMMEPLTTLEVEGARLDGRPVGRPSLVLLQGGAAAVPAAVTEPPMRLTRFGRLVLSAVVAAAIVMLALLFNGGAADAKGVPADAPRVTVMQGQTLSEIAATHLPQVDLNNAIVELQIANGLSSDQVHAGQSLVIPQLG